MRDAREVRGLSIIAKGDTPKLIDKETFLVPSQSSNKKYKVKMTNEWVCECPDFQFRKFKCKHIHSVEFLLKLRDRLDDNSVLDFAEEIKQSPKCHSCGSENIVKNGNIKIKNGKKQRLVCRNCKTTSYTEPSMNYIRNPKIISLAFDLYFKGMSLRKITDTLNQFFGFKIHHETVRRWIVRFTQKMDEYTNQFKPKTSEAWHLDEQALKSKGKIAWSWNMLDEGTRFLIANNITKERYIDDARKIIQMSKSNTDTTPTFIVTDGLRAYQDAIRKEFHTTNATKDRGSYPDTVHVRLRTIKDKPNNNLIERFHSTFRERDKTMRGFKGKEQLFADGFRNYYNFIRSHQALNGLTPSQASGIELNLDRNRWLSLLKKSLGKPSGKA